MPKGMMLPRERLPVNFSHLGDMADGVRRGALTAGTGIAEPLAHGATQLAATLDAYKVRPPGHRT